MWLELLTLTISKLRITRSIVKHNVLNCLNFNMSTILVNLHASGGRRPSKFVRIFLRFLRFFEIWYKLKRFTGPFFWISQKSVVKNGLWTHRFSNFQFFKITKTGLFALKITLKIGTCSLRMTPNQNFGKSQIYIFQLMRAILQWLFFFSLKNCCYIMIGCHQNSFCLKKRILRKYMQQK